MTTRQVAELWGVDESRIRQLCIKHRIEGAEKVAGVWLIPTPVKRIRGKSGPPGRGVAEEEKDD